MIYGNAYLRKCNLSILCLLLILGITNNLRAQELQAVVSVVTIKVNSTVDKRIFTNLQNRLTQFLNTRRWTPDRFQPHEKIGCHFILNLESTKDINIYKGTLSVQVARTAYHSTYQSTLLNYQDPDIIFKYVESQSIDFNESRISGTEPLADNLSATFAYYAYILLGMYYDSQALKAGQPFYTKAFNIVVNAPEATNIVGWKQFDGLRNRYWLAENLTNPRYHTIHEIYYSYYRLCLDKMYDEPEKARTNLIKTFIFLFNFVKDNPLIMIRDVFLNNRYIEWIGILSQAAEADKKKAVDLLIQIDVAHALKYKEALG
ncbi:MAG: DUF4835 family protein [Phycisphaerales bacterium]|nr:DUF4835 family protein [Phycisphaerales bacterium]